MLESPVSATEKSQATGTIDIQSIYVKEQTCKALHAPRIYQQLAATSPANKQETGLEMSVNHQALTDNGYEVTLQLHLTVKQQQQTLLTMEVQQAGIFKLGTFTPEQQAIVLDTYCLGLLYPYARKAVSDLALSASLPPINFEALYQQRQASKSKNPDFTAIAGEESVVTEKMTIQ